MAQSGGDTGDDFKREVGRVVTKRVRKVEKIVLFVIALVAIVLVVLSQLRCVSEGERIVVTGPNTTKVVSQPVGLHYPDAEVIAELEVGDTLKVVSYEYLKDCMIYKVILQDGREGWVTLGDNCKFINNQ